MRHHQQVGHADWVIDIAFGTCAGKAIPPANALIGRAPPVIIQIAIELKSILTEHGKARKNRLRDFNSFHGYAHQYHPLTIAAGFLVVNSADRFYSPLRPPGDVTVHGGSQRPARIVAKDAVDIFRSIHLRNSAADPPGMEAVGVVVIEHDNLNVHPNPAALGLQHQPSRLSPVPAGIRVGDPLHYQSMFQRICNAYTARFP